MSQLRLNPLTGRWVTIVAERAERPTDFAPRMAQVEGVARPCPFCPGNEDATLPALNTYNDAKGNWKVRAVPNLYPAFYGDEPLAVENHGPVWTSAPASGLHEVLVFTPRHHAQFADLNDDECTLAMHATRDRMADHARNPRIRYTQAIVNYGREAGASLSHPHGQILGMGFVPGEILDEEAGFARFEGGCLMCATLESEVAVNERVVIENDRVAIVCPYWSGTPFEMLVIPKQHELHMQDAADDDLAAVGCAIRDAVAGLRGLLGDVAYNIVFHAAPHSHSGPFHWHAHIWPFLVSIAGFERGTGVLINIKPPELAATDLRRIAASV
ncbi:MAG: galactose-1-phosphate uridylyltransferase [Acidimicrobiia bacterium]